MTPERWNRIESLFEAAVDLPPAEREAYLDISCEGEPDLRRQLDSMLSAAESSGTAIRQVLEKEARRASAPLASSPGDVSGRRFGPWRVTGIAGRGGMSAVYRAVRDDDRFRQQVAIKLLRGGLDSEFARARFRYERQILGQLEHPNIARLIDGGETPDTALGFDVPYLVLEYVEGVPITEYCREQNLTLTRCLQLFREVCAAVQHAHRHMVIHRDLKPANILVNHEGVPKLLDFGIAKMQDAELHLETVAATSTGMRLMTPEYASPEQVRGEPMSAATDIYSLGAVLFEMLTGEKAQRLTKSDPLETARVVCETATIRPSQLAPEPLRRKLAGDLDNIVLKAMQKASERRYLSVEQFSEDIRRYLDGLPVVARKDTLFYRARKFMRRNRLPLAAAALAAAGLIAGLVSSIVSARRAENRFQQVRALANTFVFQFDQELRQIPGTTKAREMLVSTALKYLDSLTKDGSSDPALRFELARAYGRIGDIQGMHGLPNLGRPQDAIESYHKALSMMRSLASTYPKNLEYQRASAEGLERLSFLETAANNLSGAKRDLHEALQLMDAGLRSRQPSAMDMRIVANGNLYLAWTEDSLGDAQAALDAARRGLEWMQRYAGIETSLRSRSDLARAWGELGRRQHIFGDLEDAGRSMQQEVTIRQEISRQWPDYLENLREWEIDLFDLGLLYGDADGPNLRQPATARQYLEDAVTIGERLLKADPNSSSAKSDLPNTYGKLANVLRETDLARALDLYRKAIAIADTIPPSAGDSNRSLHADWEAAMSYAQRMAGDRAAARKSAAEALSITLTLQLDRANPSDCRHAAGAYRALGAAALDANDLAVALDAYTKAVAWEEGQKERARTDLELAADVSAAWEGLESCDRKRGDLEVAQKLHDRRLELWQSWNTRRPSPYTNWQLAKCLSYPSPKGENSPNPP